MSRLTDDQRFEQHQLRSYERWAKKQGISSPPPIIGFQSQVKPRHITQEDFTHAYNQANSLEELGQLLNTNPITARRLCIKFNQPTKISPKFRNKVTIEKLKLAYKDSYSMRQFAEKLNCSVNAARYLCSKYYLPTNMKSEAAHRIRISQ